MAESNPDFTHQLGIHRARFPGPHLAMVVDSMVAGNTLGELWSVVQTGERPHLVLWDKGNNALYLASDSHADSSFQTLAELLAESWPQVLAEGVRRFKVRALSPWLKNSVVRLFPAVELYLSVTRFSVHDTNRQGTVPPATPPDVTFLPITPALLNQEDLAGVDEVREEIRGMWPSEDRFVERGFGTLAVVDNSVVCWCTAEYVGPRYCGIGIATSPRFRRRGIATATAAHFVRQARARGLAPCWECDSANIASMRVAEKAGFVRPAYEKYWIGFLAEETG